MPRGIVLESRLRPRLGALVFDLNISEVHSVESDITDQPVANSARKADHAIKRPRMLSMQGLISSESAGILDMIENAADAIRSAPATVAAMAAALPAVARSGDPREGLAILAAASGDGNEARHVVAWKRIVEMHDNHEVFEAYTTLERYPNMMIKRAEVVREGMDGIFVNVLLRQIEESRVAEEYNVADSFADFATGTENLGTQGTTSLQGFGGGGL